MSKLRTSVLWTLALAVLLTVFVFAAAPAASATSVDEPVDTNTTQVPEELEAPAAPKDTTDTLENDPQEPPVKQGLVEENGKIYFYNEDGTLFTGGYKEVTVDGTTRYYFFQEDGTAFTDGYKAFTKDGTRVYYYFQADGTAYTDGYLSFVVADKRYYFYFQEDGSAFTGGYKEITLDGVLHYFYFLANGQGFNTGYKTAEIDGKKYYFFFGDDARAVTNKMETITLGERTAYMLFEENGRAFTKGYKTLAGAEGTDHYYFLANGQAFTTGYKTVAIDGVTYFFFFEDNGKAFTDGLKEVPFGTETYYYFFRENGRAQTSAWETVDEKNYYFQSNGRAAKETFVTFDEKIYYFGDDCTITTGGWFCAGDGYYFADENGVLTTNTVKEGYVLDAAGKSATKYRVVQYVNKYTKSTMTDQEKIQALYNWILKSNMTYIRTYEHTKPDWVWKDSWVDDMTARHLDNWGGNCFSYAALLGFAIREATGLPVTVYHGVTPGSAAPLVPHGWATVYQDGQWYVYDVELDKFTNYATSRCYKVLATESTLHLQGEGTSISE